MNTGAKKSTLFDKIINVTLKGVKVTQLRGRHDPEGVSLLDSAEIADVTISCDNTGIKPTIDLSFGLLPDKSVLGVTVTIKNFFVDFDVRAWTEMQIVAGYRDGEQLEFFSQVYASYRETPSPDGDMVFKGIVVGSKASIFQAGLVKLSFKGKDEITIGEFLDEVNRQTNVISIKARLGTYTEVNNNTGDKNKNNKDSVKRIADIPMEIKGATFQWESTYAMCLSIQEMLSNVARAIGIDIQCMFFGDRFEIVTVGQLTEAEVSEISESTYDLSNCTYSSSRVASMVNVKAPWIPSMTPGSIFYLPQKYYSVENAALPNILAEKDIMAEKDLYRVITMNVSFNTTTNTNEMVLMGVPVSSTPPDTSSLRTYATTAELFHLKHNNEPLIERTVEGGGNLGNTSYEQLTQDGIDYTVVSGDYLIAIAQKFYPDIKYTKAMTDVVNGKQIQATELYHYGDHTVNGEVVSGLYKAKPYLKTPVYRGGDFWPLIAEATFSCINRYKDVNRKINYQVNIDTPDDIEPGWVLRIPRLNDPEQYIGQKDIFKQMFKVYRQLYRTSLSDPKLRPHKDRYGMYTAAMANIYIYMGGTNVEG